MKFLRSILSMALLAVATSAYAQTGPAQYRVNTINDLLQITIYGSSVNAWVSGGTTVGDGQGGMFYWDSSSTASTNTFSVYKGVNNTNGRWFKLSTAIANQPDLVTVGDSSTYGWKFTHLLQTNAFGLGADNNNVYLQSFASKKIHLNDNGNDVVVGSALQIGSSGTAIKASYSAASELDFPQIDANGVTNLTITVTGAGTNSVATVSKADGSLTAGITLSAYVSSTNTVTVRAANPTVNAINPATGSYRVEVHQY